MIDYILNKLGLYKFRPIAEYKEGGSDDIVLVLFDNGMISPCYYDLTHAGDGGDGEFIPLDSGGECEGLSMGDIYNRIIKPVKFMTIKQIKE